MVRGHVRAGSSRTSARAGDRPDARRGSRPARAVLDRLRARTARRRFYADYVDRASHQRIDELRPRPPRVRHVLDLGPVGRRSTTAASSSSAPTGCCTRAPAGRRPHVGRILRFDPPRPAPRGLRHRPAQPVALLVPRRRAADRRRRRPRVGGGRRRRRGRGARHRLRLAAVEGPGGPAHAAATRPPPQRRLVRDHRRLRDAGSLRLRRPLQRQAVERPLHRRDARRRPPAGRLGAPTSMSFGRDARGRSTRSASAARVVRLVSSGTSQTRPAAAA